VIEEIIQKPPVLVCIYDGPFPLHLFQGLFHVIVKADPFKESVQKPVKEKSRFMIKHVRIITLFRGRLHDPLLTPNG